MENCYDLNLVSCDFIQHTKWKSTNYGASQITVNNWKGMWILNDSREHVVDTLH